METFNDQVSFYNKRFAFTEKRFISNSPNKSLKVSVVIPAYNEDIRGFMKVLNQTKCTAPIEIELIVVLNHSETEDEDIKTKHQSQLKEFERQKLDSGILIHFIDAFNLNPKHAGVGLARKIGMDEAAKRFQEINYPGLIVCLDADCEISPNYFNSLLKADADGLNGMSLYYEHPYSDLAPSHQKSIVNYEIFLRYYSLALKSSGYPHYFQTVGSSMACRSDLYCKIGGMNRRKAGEDFYFLHKVFPHANYMEWTDTTVFPSARKSNRVPFGTGKAMIAEEEGVKDYSLLFHPTIFTELKKFLTELSPLFQHSFSAGDSLVMKFFEDENLITEIEALKSRSKSTKGFISNFYFWFDGFKVMKYLHYAQENHLSDSKNLQACQILLGTKALNSEALLIELRAMERQG